MIIDSGYPALKEEQVVIATIAPLVILTVPRTQKPPFRSSCAIILAMAKAE